MQYSKHMNTWSHINRLFSGFDNVTAQMGRNMISPTSGVVGEWTARILHHPFLAWHEHMTKFAVYTTISFHCWFTTMIWEMAHGGCHLPSPAWAVWTLLTRYEDMQSRSRYRYGSHVKRELLGATPSGRTGKWSQCLLQEMTTWLLLAVALWDLRDHTIGPLFLCQHYAISIVLNGE